MEYSVGYMMGGEYTFLSVDEAERFGELFLCEGHRKPVKSDACIWAPTFQGSFFLEHYWQEVFPLETKVSTISCLSDLEQFICEHDAKAFPLVGWKEIDEGEDFNILRFQEKFHLGNRAFSWFCRHVRKLEKPFRFVLVEARYKNPDVSYDKFEPLVRKKSFQSGSFKVGTAKEIGPFCDSDLGTVNDSDDIFVVASDEYAISIGGGKYLKFSERSVLKFKNFRELVYEFAGNYGNVFGISEKYFDYIVGNCDISTSQEELPILNENGSISDWPCLYYKVSFKGQKTRGFKTWADFACLIKRWRTHQAKWGPIYIQPFVVIGDW